MGGNQHNRGMEPTDVTEPARPEPVRTHPETVQAHPEPVQADAEPIEADAEPAEHEQHQQQPPLSTDPRLPERFVATVCALDEIDARPVADHAETYDAVHRDLRSVLDDIDRAG